MITGGMADKANEEIKAQLEDLRRREEEAASLPSHIEKIYSPDTIKKLFAHALLIDMDDNNAKVDVIKELIGEEQFMELGPGTNRVGLLGPDGCCHKIAMDRRGIVDNLTEFRRSPELEWVAPRAYETNGVILVAENVELMTKEDFRNPDNRASILEICGALAQNYIFADIGYAMKNFCNWGIRQDGSLVILDTGYLIPILGNEDALDCPVCGRRLRYRPNYTGFTCGHCGTNFSFIDIYRKINTKIEEELFKGITGFELPDLSQFNGTIYNNGVMKGGHINPDLDKPKAVEYVPGTTMRFEDLQDILKGGQA